MIVGFDADLRRVREAEHLLEELGELLRLPVDAPACTHFVRIGDPRVAISVDLDSQFGPESWEGLPQGVAAAFDGSSVGSSVGSPQGAARAAVAAAEHAARNGGRAIRFRGSDALHARLRVVDLLATTGIDAVTVVGTAGEATPDAMLDTRGYVRPVWITGRLVLQTAPAAGGLLVPFELRNPTPCCAAH